MKKILLTLSFFLAGISVLFSQANPVLITVPGDAYTQNFNTLTTPGNWTNGSSPLPGWYVTAGAGIPSGYVLNDGTNTAPSSPLNSFGSVGDPNRSLGFVPNGSNDSFQRLGLRMKNTTGSTITNISVSWDGEQWRNGSIQSQNLRLYYFISANPITNTPTTTSGLTLVNQFNSPQVLAFVTQPVALDGKNSANRQTLTANLSLNLPNNSEIMFVWIDVRDQFVSDHLFAIDNVVVIPSNLQSQTITFPEFENNNSIVYSNVSLTPGATASSGLPVTYSSSNILVASVSGQQIIVNGPGKATITASQSGGSGYHAAPSVQQVLNVSPRTPVMLSASSITTSGFSASWTIDNGNNNANVQYFFYVADNPSFNNQLTFNPSVKSQNVTSLTSGRVYNFRVVAKCDGLFSEDFSNSESVLIGSNILITTAGDWSAVIGNNTIADRITIAAPIVVDTDPELDELVINSNGSLTVSNGRNLKVNTRLVINADANNNSGKVLNNGSITINDPAQIIVRKSFDTGKWYYIGFPFNVSNVFLANTTTPVGWGTASTGGPNHIYVNSYNSSKRASSGFGAGNWEYITPNTIQANKGYALWTYNDATYDFVVNASSKGTLLGTAANIGLSNSTSSISTDRGWNYVTNPFASVYNLSQLSQGPFYVYNYNTGGFDVAMPGSSFNLSPFTPVFLQYQSASLSFANEGRKLMPASVTNSAPEFDEVNLAINYKSFQDVTRIRLKGGASEDYVIGSDAVKMMSSFANAPQLFSYTNKVPFAVNTLPYDTKEVDLYVKIGEPGDYTISLSDLTALNNCKVILVDKVTGESVDMLLQDTYQFTSYVKGTFNRFKVILSTENTDVSTSTLYVDKSGLRIFRQNGSVAFDGLNSQAQITEYDISGRKLSTSNNVDNNDYIVLHSKSVSVLEIITHNQNFRIKITNK